MEPRSLGHSADRASHEFLIDALRRARPHDAVLSEEGADDKARLAARRVWIVDPLDGTREYTEPGRGDWAVHVALAVDGHVTAAAVALPAIGSTLASATPLPSHKERRERMRIVVSRTRPPVWGEALAEHLGADLVPMGSAGAKTAAVLRGEADAYVHDGGQHEWDSAAPVGVAVAHGFHASRADGSALLYNQPLPEISDLVICRPEIAGSLLESVGAVRGGSVRDALGGDALPGAHANREPAGGQ